MPDPNPKSPQPYNPKHNKIFPKTGYETKMRTNYCDSNAVTAVVDNRGYRWKVSVL